MERELDQLQGKGLFETGWSLPSSKREKLNGSNSLLFSPIIVPATSLPTPSIL